jgi:hypothetical protein
VLRSLVQSNDWRRHTVAIAKWFDQLPSHAVTALDGLCQGADMATPPDFAAVKNTIAVTPTYC